MQLFSKKPVRRVMGLVALLFIAIPFGMSVSGCKHALAVQYCNSGDSGPQVGQVASITLAQNLATTGESLSYGQIGQSLNATAFDCKQNQVSTAKYVFATTDMSIADINPDNGSVCAGTWNRNTGGGVRDYTTCTPPATTPTSFQAFVTASAGGAVSNSIPVYIHPTVTGIVLGDPTPGAPGSCATAPDPGTDCCPANTGTVYNPTPPAYHQNSCISQGLTAQLTARVYTNGDTKPADNITCKVGHLTFTTSTASNIAQIDPNGVATADQPGSTLVSASISNSSSASSAGFFSTCPPASITLSVPGTTSTSIPVSLNNAQPLVATVVDTKGVTLTGVALEFESTTPQTVPALGSTITPIFPGTAAITALCQPPTCNPSPFSQLGYLGNGKPIQSNPITINTAGTSSTAIFMASTQSQYLLPMDFSTTLQSSPVKLPFVPNSMVISQDGGIIYLGSPQGLMTVTTGNNGVSGPNLALPGIVLAISPDGSTLVTTDPIRQTITLSPTTGSGTATAVTGGIGVRAVWSPDSQTVYITTKTNALITHSIYTDWQTTPALEPYTDATVMVPSVGAYFAGGSAGLNSGSTDGRSYCPLSNETAGTPPTEANTFAPQADSKPVVTDKVAATNIGQHILGAHATSNAGGPANFTDLQFTIPVQTTKTGAVVPAACPPPNTPVTYTSTFTTLPITGTPVIAATAITGVFPTSGQVVTSNNQIAFVTYTGTGAQLPEYVLPASGAAGTLTYVPLSGTATAPISGVWSTDNTTFYTGTSGDNLVHQITQSCTTTVPITCTWKDSGQITPSLPNASGSGFAPVDMIVQKPRKVTS